MTDGPNIPETISVSATRKIQLDQYEPISAHITQEYDVPDGIDRDYFESWRQERQDDVMAAAENAAMRRHEEYVREEATGGD